MSLTKLHKILKKYKQFHKQHVDSWEFAQKRINAASKRVADKMDDPEKIFICSATYKKESYDYQSRGNKLFDEMMEELEGQEVFPKKTNKTNEI